MYKFSHFFRFSQKHFLFKTLNERIDICWVGSEDFDQMKNSVLKVLDSKFCWLWILRLRNWVNNCISVLEILWKRHLFWWFDLFWILHWFGWGIIFYNDFIKLIVCLNYKINQSLFLINLTNLKFYIKNHCQTIRLPYLSAEAKIPLIKLYLKVLIGPSCPVTLF